MNEAVIPFKHLSQVIAPDGIRRKKLAIPVSILIASLLASCAAPVPPGIVDQIKALPPAPLDDIFPGTSNPRGTQKDQAALLEVYTELCQIFGCDPRDLLKRTTFSQTRDPVYMMITRPSEDLKPPTMTVYNAHPIYKCDVGHETTHMALVPRMGPSDLAEAIGQTGTFRFDGFSMTSSTRPKDKATFSTIEEAFADAMSLWVGKNKKVRCPTGYGEVGHMFLAIAEKKKIPMEDIINDHKTSDLIGFLTKLSKADKTNHEKNFLYYVVLSSLMDDLRNRKIKLDDALNRFDLFEKGNSGMLLPHEMNNLWDRLGTSTSVALGSSAVSYLKIGGFQPIPETVYSGLPQIVERKKSKAVISGSIKLPPPEQRGNKMRPISEPRGRTTDFSGSHKKAHRRGKQS